MHAVSEEIQRSCAKIKLKGPYLAGAELEKSAPDGDLLAGPQPDLGARRRRERYLFQLGDLDRVAGCVAVGQCDLEHPRRRVGLLVALRRGNISDF